ncbi:hypothetical protein WR25_14075 [Diploscapter pachys]|uniref:Uncharacterized protein n=1 Tax=Diploscapter pachys TaxID=2018661 RepID=A0A2A2J670_9BILA|nr:hypothetical protein WR25_14075 [Diploscapter pachys]
MVVVVLFGTALSAVQTLIVGDKIRWKGRTLQDRGKDNVSTSKEADGWRNDKRIDAAEKQKWKSSSNAFQYFPTALTLKHCIIRQRNENGRTEIVMQPAEMLNVERQRQRGWVRGNVPSGKWRERHMKQKGG